MDTTTKFDKRLQHIPEPWRGALVDVVDTAEAICLGLQQPAFGVGNPAIQCPQLVADLTRLACERSNTASGSIAIDPRLVSFSRTISGNSTMFDAVDNRGRIYWRSLHNNGADTGWNQWGGGIEGIFNDAPVPVPASERLPSKDDCSKDGFYWCNNKITALDCSERFAWVLSRIEDENEETDFPPCTHWLPYGALPHFLIPTATDSNVPTN